MTQPTAQTPSLELYLQRNYVHKRLEEEIPVGARHLVDYNAVMSIFGIAALSSFRCEGKQRFQFVADGSKTPTLIATMQAASVIYNLGYEVGHALRGTAKSDLAIEPSGGASLTNFASNFEIIVENVFTYFRPNKQTAEFRKANRNTPGLHALLPPKTVM